LDIFAPEQRGKSGACRTHVAVLGVNRDALKKRSKRKRGRKIIKDKSGEPRSIEELQEVINALKKELVGGELQPLMIFFPTIMDGLAELIEWRKKYKGGKK